jgi:hypothetical protein
MSIALRPMNTGEVLDRTFNLYRNNFSVFVGIAILPAAMKLVLTLVQFGLISTNRITVFGAASVSSGSSGWGSFLLSMVVLFGVILASAATVYAVSMLHLGKSTSIGESYRAISPYIGRLAGIFFLLILITIGVAIPLVGVPTFFGVMAGSPIFLYLGMLIGGAVVVHLYVCLSLATAACVVERTRIIASLKRSMELSRGARGRIWLIFILYIVLSLALGFAIGAPLGAIAYATRSIFIMALISPIAQFLGGTFVAPILTIPLVLVYYDQRVRKEAFDLQVMMDALGQSGPEQVISAAPIG